MTITVHKGAIKLFGAVLRVGPKKYVITAGATSSLPIIECTNIRGKLQEKFIETPENSHMRDLFTSVVLIESLRTGLENIPALFPNDFKTIWSYEGTKLEPRTFSIVLRASSSINVVIPLESWASMVKGITEYYKAGHSPVILIGGFRSSGKSTFAKYLANSMINKCGENTTFYLECDPKHPEYSPLGIVSLHKLDYDFSSAFGHSTMEYCVKAHSIGDVNPKNAYTSYINAISELIDHFRAIQRKSSKRCSLIINTPGFTKGLGLQLLEDISRISKQSHLVYMGADADIETYQDFEERFPKLASSKKLLKPESILSSVESANNLPGRGGDWITSTNVQDLQLLSYFHYRTEDKTYEFSKPITHFKPYAVPYAQIGKPAHSSFIQAFGVSFGDGVLGEDIELCLTGSVVSIIAVQKTVELNVSPAGSEESEEITNHEKSNSIAPLPWLKSNALAKAMTPSNSLCLGLGLIQAIDRAACKVRLLTPIDVNLVLQQLESNGERLILVRGSIQYPSMDMLWLKNNTANTLGKLTLRDPVTKKRLASSLPFFSDKEPVGVEGHIKRLKEALKP